MEEAKIFVSPLTKRGRTSNSPRRSSRNSSLQKNRTQQKVHTSSSQKQNKTKRRSSMRRSLVATLEYIQSKETTNADRTPTLGLNRQAMVIVEKLPEPVVQKLSASDDLAKIECRTIARLKAEHDGWMEQLEKYKRLQSDSSNSFDSGNIMPQEEKWDSKYQHWQKQISDLEEKVCNVLSVGNATMSNIRQIKKLHMIKVQKEIEELYNTALRERCGGDSKLLIKNIFKLHDMISDE